MAKYSDLCQTLRDEILSGVISGNMPSMRMLMERFQVSHITILRVFKELQEAGLIRGENKKVYRVNKVFPNRNLLVCLLRTPADLNDLDNFGLEINLGVQQAAQERHVNVLFPHQCATVRYLGTEDTPLLQLKAELSCILNRVCGFLIAAPVTDRQLEQYILPMAENLPVVTVCRRSALPGVGSVVMPTEKACRELAGIIGASQYGRFILCQSVYTTDHMRNQCDLVERYLLEAGRKKEDILRCFELLERPEYEHELNLMCSEISRAGQKKVMIFASSTRGACFLSRELQARGFTAGKDYGLCSYDGKTGAYRNQPKITTMRVPGEALGRAAVDLALSEHPAGTAVEVPYRFDRNETF